ncbi:hypothetical protein ZIOFF_004491 [Zingiber officinale]|uniref:Uncharacterized protein n=1 Tax=Zingiber officinale TaxID=94328 RepID=A0A8J5HL95_ZINOF|nr:hypothetical protein ZIOFF_004491 [Zingiber officinale]
MAELKGLVRAEQLMISSTIQEIKRAIAEKNSVVTKSKDDAADLKKKLKKLDKELEESEREYQVPFSVNFILLNFESVKGLSNMDVFRPKRCSYLLGVHAGKSSRDDEKCLEDQQRDVKTAVGDVESELKQLKTKIFHSEDELKEKRGQPLA